MEIKDGVTVVDAGVAEIDLLRVIGARAASETLYTILCKYLLSVVVVQAVTELDNKAAHRHAPVPQRHRPFL